MAEAKKDALFLHCLPAFHDTLTDVGADIKKKFGLDASIDVKVVDKNESGLLVKLPEVNIDAFLHQNQLSWTGNFKEQLQNFKKGDNIKVKIVDISVENSKILVSKKALEQDPMSFWEGKKIDDIVTTRVISVDKISP